MDILNQRDQLEIWDSKQEGLCGTHQSSEAEACLT